MRVQHDQRDRGGKVTAATRLAIAGSRLGTLRSVRLATWVKCRSTRQHRRALLLPIVILTAGMAGCGGPKTAAPPTSAEAVAAFSVELSGRIDSVAAAPATAVREIDLAIESLAGYAASQGEPFSSWLAAAREVRAAWGPNPSKAAVAQGLSRLRALVQAEH